MKKTISGKAIPSTMNPDEIPETTKNLYKELVELVPWLLKKLGTALRVANSSLNQARIKLSLKYKTREKNTTHAKLNARVRVPYMLVIYSKREYITNNKPMNHSYKDFVKEYNQE